MPAKTSPGAPSQHEPRPGGDSGRRAGLAVALVLTVMAGLSLSYFWHGPLSGAVGDALYAVMVYLLVAFLAPGARTTAVGGVAFGVCVIIELAQLTGVPATLVRAWWPARYLLGTTFQAVDLVAYAAGCVSAVVLDRASARSSSAGVAANSGRSGGR